MIEPERPLLLRVSEVAFELGIARSAAYELCRTGHLPVVRFGRSVRVPRKLLEAWIERQSELGQQVGTRLDR